MTEKEEPGQLVEFEKMVQRFLEMFEIRMKQFILQAVKQSQGTVYNFEGANFQNCSITGNMSKTGPENNYESSNHQKNNICSDDQIADALEAIVGENKVINRQWKWVGAYWFLRWACNYPVDIREFCEKIESLKLNIDARYKCVYDNMRKFCTLSFIDYDPLKIDNVKYSKIDANVFAECRSIVLKLNEELGKSYLPKP